MAYEIARIPLMDVGEPPLGKVCHPFIEQPAIYAIRPRRHPSDRSRSTGGIEGIAQDSGFNPRASIVSARS